MKTNAEFVRQLWLNCTHSAVLWTLGIAGLLCVVPYAVAGAQAMAILTSSALWITLLFYGAYLAGNSLRQELQQKTWDWQRMSSLTPWQMSWGKWLGATAPAWLYAACFITAGLLAQSLSPHANQMTGSNIAMAVVWGMAAQVWVMNAVLLSWSDKGSFGWRRAMMLPVLMVFLIPSRVIQHVWQRIAHEEDHAIWWFFSLSPVQSVVLVGSALTALGLLGVWRQLSQRLDVPTLPWAWPAGIAGLALLLAGFFPITLSSALSWLSCIAFMATAYIALHSMDNGLQQWREVQWHSTRGQWKGAWQSLPLWPVSWLLGVVAAVIWMLVPGRTESFPVSSAWLVALVGLHLLRDALILTGFSLMSGKLRSPLAAFSIAWLALNVLLPLLLGSVAGSLGRVLASAMQPLVGYAVLEASDMPAWVYLLMMLVQAAIALGWVVWVFKDRIRRVPEASLPSPAL